VCGVNSWRRATLDGIIEATGTVWEAKHTSAFAKAEEVLERYMPQLQHNMAVTGYQQAVLSVIFGNHKYEVFEVAADWLYQIELLQAEQRFWTSVLTGEPPVAVEPPPPPRPIGTREVCLEGNNAWASAAFDWLTHRDAAKIHASACAAIKAQVEEDVSRAFGHGIEAKRSKSGAITIRELA
jgi:predicted phage-related endonuclease